MSGDLVIRPLAREDLESLLALYRHLHEQDDPLPDAARVNEIWEGLVHDPAYLYIGGFVGGALVTACNAAVIPNLTRGARPYAVIENVVTDPGHRRRGIGAKVLQVLLDQCWARRCYKVMLTSAIARADIHGFYESLGFDRTSKQAFVIMAR
jgi:GNAT superfamily N-acetyltransferase